MYVAGESMEQYLEIGKIINKRGIRGELKIESYCASPEDFSVFETVFLSPDGADERTVESCKPYRGFVYLKLSHVETPEAADRLRGKTLYVHRSQVDLDEGDFLIADLIGLPVYDADNGKEYGTIVDIVNYGRNDIYVIRKDGAEYMLPAVDEFIVETDLDRGVAVRPIPGLFDEQESR